MLQETIIQVLNYSLPLLWERVSAPEIHAHNTTTADTIKQDAAMFDIHGTGLDRASNVTFDIQVVWSMLSFNVIYKNKCKHSFRSSPFFLWKYTLMQGFHRWSKRLSRCSPYTTNSDERFYNAVFHRLEYEHFSCICYTCMQYLCFVHSWC